MTRARVPLTVEVAADPTPIDLDAWARRVTALALALHPVDAAAASPPPPPDIMPAPARPLRRAA